MARKILGAIRFPQGQGGGKQVYGPGDEKALAALDLPKDVLLGFQRKGLVSGFAVEERAPLPSIRELKAHVAALPREEVEALAAEDERSTAQAIYQARLDELDEAEAEDEA